MSICDDCVLFGRCAGHCSDKDDYNEDWERENDFYDSLDYSGETDNFDY